ncbi:hypothetical protein CCYA_CCYA08G2371 [Cyanidiococcus yangmingshanensis]|nr:hypothetical protein CCYA_CCYA08G2371 [Cyanidiococcus yangmingshanensis]
MHLDASQLRHLSDAELRVLTAVELGMRNHEQVPVELVGALSGRRGAHKSLHVLLRHKLVHHESKPYESYRLTPLGYDYLALRALRERSSVCSVGSLIGTGKESDVHEVLGGVDGSERFALKVHRLGRTSFRQARTKRDYCVRGLPRLESASCAGTEGPLFGRAAADVSVQGEGFSEAPTNTSPSESLRRAADQRERRSVANWLYLSRLAAQREFEALELLFRHGLPVPEPIDASRHCVVQRLVPNATLLCHLRSLRDPEAVFRRLWDFQDRLATLGLVHGDLNEFNVLVDNETEHIVVIDFPQIVLLAHREGPRMLERDRRGLVSFFYHRFGVAGCIERGMYSDANGGDRPLAARSPSNDGELPHREDGHVIQNRLADESDCPEDRSLPERAAHLRRSPSVSGLDTAKSEVTERLETAESLATSTDSASACERQKHAYCVTPDVEGWGSWPQSGSSSELHRVTNGTNAGLKCDSAFAHSRVVVSTPDARTISQRLQVQYARSRRNQALREATRLGKSRPRRSRGTMPTPGWI